MQYATHNKMLLIGSNWFDANVDLHDDPSAALAPNPVFD